MVFERLGAEAFWRLIFMCVGISSGSRVEENVGMVGMGGTAGGVVVDVMVEVMLVFGRPMPTPETWRAS